MSLPSKALAVRRRATGLTQPRLAEIAGVSVTTIGHAETGRLWQSRRFWEHAGKGVSAGGELLALHDAHRAAAVPAGPATATEGTGAKSTTDAPPAVAVAATGPVTCVTITWADGAVTTVYPPETPARPADATPANCPRGPYINTSRACRLPSAQARRERTTMAITAAAETKSLVEDVEHGRSLLIVEALSARWGWTPQDPGKAVFAIFTREG
jgi:hypothetical protein